MQRARFETVENYLKSLEPQSGDAMITKAFWNVLGIGPTDPGQHLLSRLLDLKTASSVMSLVSGAGVGCSWGLVISLSSATQSAFGPVRLHHLLQGMGCAGLASRCLIQAGGVPGPGVQKTGVPWTLEQILLVSWKGRSLGDLSTFHKSLLLSSLYLARLRQMNKVR